MANPQGPQGNHDPAGSTQMFRAFVDEGPQGRRQQQALVYASQLAREDEEQKEALTVFGKAHIRGQATVSQLPSP